LVCLAGFGDSAAMFEPLRRLRLPAALTLLELPGFGGSPAVGSVRTIDEYAGFVVDAIGRHRGRVGLVAHSVASVIASVATARIPERIAGLLSLEGNLTEADAYFSGSAAEFATPSEFIAAFGDRLARLAVDDPIVDRYRRVVAEADPDALWELGRSARTFSAADAPGALLLELPVPVRYLYNPANCPAETVDWLSEHDLDAHQVPGVSHWPTIDAPDIVARQIEVFFEPLFAAG
jgi:pimeloyl-ACP methyl ester carboxylesterase